MIHRSASGGKYCQVAALMRRYIHMRNNKATVDDILSYFWDHFGKANVTDNNMILAIRTAVITLCLDKNGIIPSRVGSHSLRAGGAMALKFAGANREDIKKMGRWSSDTWMVCIHDQIVEYSKGWTKKWPFHVLILI